MFEKIYLLRWSVSHKLSMLKADHTPKIYINLEKSSKSRQKVEVVVAVISGYHNRGVVSVACSILICVPRHRLEILVLVSESTFTQLFYHNLVI